jgi:Right handed beta helix region
MHNIFKITLLTFFLVTAASVAAQAGTWRVELDGTGDFSDIQPAVEASANGDTILIGPGRFDTLHPCVAPAWVEEAIVAVVQDNLTFIGSGTDQTIIGMTEYYWSNTEYPKGFCSVEGYSGRIEHLTIENIERGIFWERGELFVEDCVFRGDHASFGGASLYVDGGGVTDCRFEIGSNGVGLACGQTDSVHVVGCEFDGYGMGFTTGPGVRYVSFTDCSFSGNRLAMAFAFGTSGRIENTTVLGAYSEGVAITGNLLPMELVNLHIVGGQTGLMIDSGAGVSGEGIVIEGTTVESVEISSDAIVSLTNSHFLPATGIAVNVHGYYNEPYELDFTGNYWGTSDPDSIAALISDGQDDSNVHCIVRYEPFSAVPLPSEKPSLGGFKSLFR